MRTKPTTFYWLDAKMIDVVGVHSVFGNVRTRAHAHAAAAAAAKAASMARDGLRFEASIRSTLGAITRS